jgi:hypothetical protein
MAQLSQPKFWCYVCSQRLLYSFSVL